MQFELTQVRPACSKSSLTSLSSEDGEKVDENWTQQLIEGATVCVECQSVAMRRKLGARCRGHGVLSKETRWSAIATTTTGCHGKWVMKSRDQGCQCASDSLLSFILIWIEEQTRGRLLPVVPPFEPTIQTQLIDRSWCANNNNNTNNNMLIVNK